MVLWFTTEISDQLWLLERLRRSRFHVHDRIYHVETIHRSADTLVKYTLSHCLKTIHIPGSCLNTFKCCHITVKMAFCYQNSQLSHRRHHCNEDTSQSLYLRWTPSKADSLSWYRRCMPKRVHCIHLLRVPDCQAVFSSEAASYTDLQLLFFFFKVSYLLFIGVFLSRILVLDHFQLILSKINNVENAKCDFTKNRGDF